MPIDPSIALGVRPVQFADPVESYGRALTLRHLIQQGQLGAEQLHGAQLENQQHEQAIQDDQTIRQLYGQSGGDMGKLQQLAAGKVSPQMLEKLRAAALDTWERLSKIKETDLKNVAAQNAAVASSASAILKLPADQRPAAYQQERAQLLQQGILTPDHAPEQYPGDDALQLQLDHATAADTQFNQEMKRREDARAASAETRAAAESAATLPGKQADSQMKTAVAAGMANPDDPAAQIAGMTPEQRAQLKLRADEITKLNSPAELAFKANDPKSSPETRQAAKDALKLLEQHAIASRSVTQVTMLPSANGPGAQLTGDEFLKSLPPGTAGQVKAIAEGRATLPSATSRSQAAIQLRDAVFRYDPSYSDQRAQIRKAFTTGTDGKNIGNLNTAIVHLDALKEIAAAMDSGNFQPGNALFNKAREIFGSAVPTNYEGLRQAVAGEQDQALHGTSTIEGRNAILATMPAKASKGQMAGIVDTGLQTMATKLNTYAQRHRQQLPDDNVYSPILPAAQAVLTKHGIGNGQPAAGGAQISVTDPQGGVHVFADQAAADKFKKLAGIK